MRLERSLKYILEGFYFSKD